MHRGEGEPCISWKSLEMMQAHGGPLCPRVELLPGNEVAAELALTAVRLGADNALWGRLFDIHCQEKTAEQKLDLLYRVMAGAGHEDIQARMQRLRQQQKKGK